MNIMSSCYWMWCLKPETYNLDICYNIVKSLCHLNIQSGAAAEWNAILRGFSYLISLRLDFRRHFLLCISKDKVKYCFWKRQIVLCRKLYVRNVLT